MWDDVTHPEAPFHGKEEVGKVYSSILDAIPDVVLESVRRFTGEDGRFVVDESLLTGHVQEEWSGMQGGGAPVEVRILHIFELRDGLICYENAWFDASAVQRQILEFGADSEGNRGGIATTQTLGLGRGPLLGHLGSWAISRK